MVVIVDTLVISPALRKSIYKLGGSVGLSADISSKIDDVRFGRLPGCVFFLGMAGNRRPYGV